MSMSEKCKKLLTYIAYTLIVVGIFTLFFWVGNFKSFQNFISKIEASSFDVRQQFISSNSKENELLDVIYKLGIKLKFNDNNPVYQIIDELNYANYYTT